jgi:hypothetical protein
VPEEAEARRRRGAAEAAARRAAAKRAIARGRRGTAAGEGASTRVFRV